MRLPQRLAWFVVAGGAGFVVDAGLLKLLVFPGGNPIAVRVVSLLAAMTATWLINRSHTFGDRAGAPTVGEFLRYVAASLVGALVNFGIYTALVVWGGPFREEPVLALVISTAVSMTVNFLSYLKLVFAPKPPR